MGGPLLITLCDDLLRYSLHRMMADNIVRHHISAPSRCRWQGAHDFHVNLRMANPDKGQRNLRTTREVLANKLICGLPILEPL
jgi:hypothetical protein